MRDLSLHVLDLLENSLRAGATVVALSVAADPAADTLRLTIEDDGPGLPAAPEAVLDPFFTTKAGKRTGLGLPLFRASVEQAAGRLALGRSPLGGLQVEATMQLSHVDRLPMGDLATTVATLACTNPGVDFRCRLSCGPRECCVSAAESEKALPLDGRDPFHVAWELGGRLRRAMAELALPT